MLTISYLITSHNETDTLFNLLNKIDIYLRGNCDEVIILDDFSNNPKTKEILSKFKEKHPESHVKIIQHSLNNDYGAHKNFGIENCTKDYIFQLDGDEIPPDSLLGESLYQLLESNPSIETYAVPRINDFHGVTSEHATKWGWRLTQSPIYKRPIVNFPDYQFRIFKRDYPRIRFLRKLHEKIEGYNSYSVLPPEEEWAIYHDKTIEKQIETNLRYNKDFSQKENQGHNVFEK